MLLVGQSLTLHRGHLARALAARVPMPLIHRARRQIEAGAEALDVNVGRTGSVADLTWVIQTLRDHGVNVPLWLDCADTEVIASVLRACNNAGPLVANGLAVGDREYDGERALVEAVADGAHGLVISPRLTSSTVPHARLSAAASAIERARTAGFTGTCYVDALVWPPATDPDACSRSLAMLRLIARELPEAEPLAAVGNVSHGLTPRVARFARALYAAASARSGARALILPVEDTDCVNAAGTGVAQPPPPSAPQRERDGWEAAHRLMSRIPS